MIASCILLGGPSIQAAMAEEGRPVEVLISDSVTHDSNVFRLPGPSQSDTINVASVGLRIDKPYAQQRFQLNVSETVTRYANLSHLNSDALGYRGAWLWHLTPRWGGTLSAERQTASIPFADAQGNERILRTTDNYGFTLDGGPFGGWHVLFGISQNQQKNDQPFLAQPSTRTRSAEAGLKYETASGNSVSVIQRLSHGTPVDDNAFRQDESELRANWNLSGKSVLQGRLTRVDRHYEHFAEGDFSGLTGELGYIWKPTGKLSVGIIAKRNITSFLQTSPSSSYRVDDSFSLTPSWQVSAKTTIGVRLERMQSDFRGAAGTVRSDTLHNAQLTAGWSPLRNLALGASLQRQWRSSNSPDSGFNASIVGANAKLTF